MYSNEKKQLLLLSDRAFYVYAADLFTELKVVQWRTYAKTDCVLQDLLWLT